MGTLKLNERPDGYGFLYGEFIDDKGERHNVNVMPPRRAWDGDIQLEGYEPQENEWIIYVAGKEAARVIEQLALESTIAKCLE